MPETPTDRPSAAAPLSIHWSTTVPNSAQMPAQRGGTWQLTVVPRDGWRSYVWRVVHSDDASLSCSGSASTVNFAKGQAEQAVTELDGIHP